MFDFYIITGPEDSKQENFSTLCTCLLMRLYPQAQTVDGSGGDEGIDTYIGNFDGHIKIFQHKYFINTLKTSQKRQILSSFNQAVRLHRPTIWTLMLPKDLTPAEIRWFESIQKDKPGIKIEFWGKTRLIELLIKNKDLAAAFQPATPITLLVLDKSTKSNKIASYTLSEKLTELGYGSQDQIVQAVSEKLDYKEPQSKLNVIVWGPGKSDNALYSKRVEIRNRLREFGHMAYFSEELLSPEVLSAGGLNVAIEEYLQVKSFDYIICLMVSPGSIGEVHDFSKNRDFACKMMVCVDQEHKKGYSAFGTLRIFEGLNGKIDWFKNPDDIIQCHLATRVLRQIEKTAEAKIWELLQ